MNPRTKPPRPILDTLAVLSSQRCQRTSADALSAMTGIKNLPNDAPQDYAQVIRFLLS